MLRRLFFTTLLSSSLLTSGCYGLEMRLEADQPILLNAVPSRGQPNFVRQQRVMYFLWGLVNTQPRVVEQLLDDTGEGPVTSFDIYSEMDAISVVSGIFTIGIVTSRVVRVEGRR